MKYSCLKSPLTIAVCTFLLFTACGGSSTGPGNNNDNAPAAPVNLSGSSGNQEVKLTWAANNEDDLSGYNLYRSTSSFSSISDMEPVNGSELIPSPGYTDKGLKNGTTYLYRITAVDENGNESKLSSELKITPFSDPPDHP